MSQQALAAEDVLVAEDRRHLGNTVLLLALGLACLGLVFRAEVTAAVNVWEVSTAYNHCFLIIPIVLYVIWDRRDALRGLRANPLPIAALAGLPPAIGWLLAERLGIMEGRQLMVVTSAEVLFLAVLGWRLWWAVSGPLLYLFFLVPFGEFLVPKLQDITAVFIRFGMGFTSIPAYIDGYTIEIPAGTFYVAEACAGLRFLIASIAFGVLYALMMYRSPVRRGIFILVSIVVPIIANGFRALGIVVLGHYLGSADAAAADHILYGWIFFSIVILLLTLLGLPFRQDLDRLPPPERDSDRPPPARWANGAAAVIASVAVAAISPAAVVALERSGASAVAAPAVPRLAGGCEVVGQEPVDPASIPGRALTVSLRCGETTLDMWIETFSPRSTSGPVVAERRRLTRAVESENVTDVPVPGPDGGDTGWRLIHSTTPPALAVAAIWIDGERRNAGLGMRIEQARASLSAGDRGPVLIVVKPDQDLHGLRPDQRRTLEQALITFVQTQTGLDAEVRAMARSRN